MNEFDQGELTVGRGKTKGRHWSRIACPTKQLSDSEVGRRYQDPYEETANQ